MRSTQIIREICLATVVLFLLMFCVVNSAAGKSMTEATDKWQYEFTIYGWFTSIDGQLKYEVPPDNGSEIGVDISQILDSLNFIFMGIFETRKNKLSFGLDLVYLDLSNSRSTDITVGPGPGVPLTVTGGLGLKSWLVTGVVGYDVVQTNKSRMAVIGGFRYLDLSADVDISIDGPLPPTPPPAFVSGSNDFWDAIVGIKGAFMLSEHWYIPYYADIGAGDSNLTWQLFGGIGYQFNWGDIKLGYRYLEYSQDDDKFVQDLKFYGPLLGLGFRF